MRRNNPVQVVEFSHVTGSTFLDQSTLTSLPPRRGDPSSPQWWSCRRSHQGSCRRSHHGSCRRYSPYSCILQHNNTLLQTPSHFKLYFGPILLLVIQGLSLKPLTLMVTPYPTNIFVRVLFSLIQIAQWQWHSMNPLGPLPLTGFLLQSVSVVSS